MQIVLAILLGLGVLLVVALMMTLPLMWLWNWLMPVIFSLPKIGAMQAFGLILMSGLLFRNGSSSSSSS